MKLLFAAAGLLVFFLTANSQEDTRLQAERAFEDADYPRALQLYRESADKYLAQERLVPSTECQLRVVSCHLAMGNPEAGLDLANATLTKLTQNLPDSRQLSAKAYTLLGESQLNMGRNDLALENLQLAERLFEASNSPDLAECYENLGIIYWNNGNLDLSTQYHEKALRIRQEIFGDRSEQTADSYNNLGVINLGVDGFRASLYLRRALSIYEAALGPNHPKVAFGLTNLSRANADEGNTKDALEILQRVSGIWDDLYDGPHPSKAFTQSNIGRIHAENENWEEAEQSQQAALATYISLYGEKHPEIANTYFLLGSIQEKKQNWKEAILYYQQSIYANLYDQQYTNVDALPELRGYYNADILLSSLIAKAKALEILHIDKTMKPRHLQQALDTFAKCDTLISQIRQLRVSESDKIRLGQLAKEVYENAIRIALILTRQPFAKEKYQEIAFGYCERSKSAVLLEAISETNAKNFAGLPESILSMEDSLKAEIAYLNQQLAAKSGGADEGEYKNRLFQTDRSYRLLVNRIETEYPKYFELKYQTNTASAAELASLLTEEQAILSYFVGEKKIYLFLITSKGIDVIEKERNDDFASLISGLRNAVRYRVPKVLITSAQALYSLLIPSLPKNITTLHIIPDGLLGTIPFESLSSATANTMDFASQRFLVEDYALGYDYSATLLANKLNSAKSSSDTSPGILLTAPVDFDLATRMVSLEGTRRETNTIKYFFDDHGWNTKLVMNEEANESFLKSQDLLSYDILHFATHGLVHESKPELSRIYLRGTDSEDGILYSGEIYNLKVDAQLVTLSACETGLGKLAKGEGIVGLSRALLYAGAENLIVSLWPVADQSTSDLMIRFYQDLLEQKGNFSNPLRQAKLALLRSEDYNDPYFWAPFILIGN